MNARLRGYREATADLTIHARIVIIDGLDGTAEVKLHILLNEARVKRTQVTTFVIHTGDKTNKQTKIINMTFPTKQRLI